MELFEKYLINSIIEIKVKDNIESSFIKNFINDYKKLLIEKNNIGDSFLEEVKTLRIKFEKFELDKNQDFDLLFISYLTLFKIEFENVAIEIHFSSIHTLNIEAFNATVFKLVHHKQHLRINTKKEIFKIFVDNKENNIIKIVQSASYIPIIYIDKHTFNLNFKRKEISNSYDKIVMKSVSLLDIKKVEKGDFFSAVQEKFNDLKDNNINNWLPDDLGFLYAIKLLDELHILQHIVNKFKGVKSSYNVGKSIMYSSTDNKSATLFKDTVMRIIESYEVFKFSNVEIYFLSIIIQNSKLFKIPISINEMYLKIEPFLTDSEKVKAKADDRFLKKKYIEVYEYNLKKSIAYTKEVCYGLEELAKNIFEHSNVNKNEGFGIISGRIYTHTAIKNLKNIENDWLANYNTNFKYLDINVIDTGTNDLMKSYQNTLKLEKDNFESIEDEQLKIKLKKEYDSDIKEIANFDIKNFFNNDSLKLIHQVNRTKAKIGLLIFSQIILDEKKAYAKIASSNLKINQEGKGYILFNSNAEVKPIEDPNAYLLGTNYNFIIPFNEKLEFKKVSFKSEENKTSAASSVFVELFNYLDFDENKAKIKIVPFLSRENYNDVGKYLKIDKLKSEIGTIDNSKDVLHIDYSNIKDIIQNSSDWFRFLSELQFQKVFFSDIIITNFDIDLYLELIQILKIFSNKKENEINFWDDNLFILFFFPIKNDNNHKFWFNHLLTTIDYKKFLKINEDIDLYHQNLARIIEHEEETNEVNIDYEKIESKLFSKNGKLLNFELVLKNEFGISFFEETLKSTLNIEIENSINENK